MSLERKEIIRLRVAGENERYTRAALDRRGARPPADGRDEPGKVRPKPTPAELHANPRAGLAVLW